MPRFVSAVEGHLAPRFGTAHATPARRVEHVMYRDSRRKPVRLTRRQPGSVHNHEHFGVTRTHIEVEPAVKAIRDGAETIVKAAKTAPRVTWNTEAVHLISDAELARFGREYEQMLAEGALVERTEDDFKAWQAKQAEATKTHDAKVAAEAKKAAEAARAAKQAPPKQDPPSPPAAA